MTYLQAVAYLNSFINYENKNNYPYKKLFKLEGIQGFLRRIGNPQESLKCLHIAGTKGKGSVCIFAASILREAGYTVGLYTSPHLVDFRERIRVLRRTKDDGRKTMDAFEGMISKRELAVLVNRLKPYIEEHNRISQYGSLTFFEVWTALAFVYFKEQGVDYAVLETGLGGRLDATNTVNPLVCAITPISYDHTAQLGNTLKEIAAEKAGIIKTCDLRPATCDRLAVISAPQEREAQGVIQKRCLKEKAKLYEVGKDIVWRARTVKGKWRSFEVRGLKRKYTNLKIKLLGEHQLDNASLAIGVAEVLENKRISPQVIKRGLMNARWPGRCEVISENPVILLDGAQNRASVCALKDTINPDFARAKSARRADRLNPTSQKAVVGLPIAQAIGFNLARRGNPEQISNAKFGIKEEFTYTRLILILGISSDKDIQGICREFYDFAGIIILTQADNPRAYSPDALARNFSGRNTVVTHSVKESLRYALRIAEKEDLILITGSLFVVGEARRFLIRDGSHKTVTKRSQNGTVLY